MSVPHLRINLYACKFNLASAPAALVTQVRFAVSQTGFFGNERDKHCAWPSAPGQSINDHHGPNTLHVHNDTAERK